MKRISGKSLSKTQMMRMRTKKCKMMRTKARKRRPLSGGRSINDLLVIEWPLINLN
jgi:hypothetical protein